MKGWGKLQRVDYKLVMVPTLSLQESDKETFGSKKHDTENERQDLGTAWLLLELQGQGCGVAAVVAATE